MRVLENLGGRRLLWVLSGVLPLASFAAVMLFIFTQQQERAINRLLYEAGINSAHVVDLAIREQIGLLNGLAVSRALDKGDFEAFRLDAQRLWSMHPEWRTIILTDEKRQVFNLRFPAGAALPLLRDPVSLSEVWQTGKPFIGDLTHGFVAIRVPVTRNDGIVYSLVAPTNPQFFLAALHGFQKTGQWEIIIAGSDNVVIAASPQAPVTAGMTLPPPFRQHSREVLSANDMLYASPVSIDFGKWRIFVFAPAASIETPFVKRRAVAYLSGFLAVVFTALLVLALSSAWAAGQETTRLRREMDERNRAQKALQESEQRRRLAQEAAQTGTWEWDLETNANIWSDELWSLYELEPNSCEPSFDEWRRTIHPEDRHRTEQAIQEAVRQSAAIDIEWRVNVDDRNERWLMARGQPLVDQQGRAVRYLGIVMDISERKRVEEVLRHSLAEKDALLSEVHHRVKNNLQIVASLLSLQASHAPNEEVVDILHDTRNRIRSMALLHEVLYSSGNLARINFAAYVKELCTQLIRFSGPQFAAVKVENRVAPIGLALEQAVPCGLIISELVSNSLKHGFPDGRGGQVVVELRPEDGHRSALYVRDDGVGMPPDFDLAETSTLGLKLVTNLAGQLGGEFAVELPRNGGVAFKITFPIPGDTPL